jgi:hypothetical protein
MKRRILDQRVIMRRRLENSRALTRFHAEVESIVTDDPESFWRCAHLLAELARSRPFDEFLAHELSLLRDDSTHSIANSREISLDLFATDRWDVGVHLHRPRLDDVPARINCPAEHVMSTMVHGKLQNQMFSIPGGPENNEVFVKGLKLEPRGVHEVVSGAVSFIRAGRDAHYTLAPTGEAMSLNMVYLNAVPLRWTFDGKTLESVQASAGDVTNSRIEFAMKVLTMMPVPASADALERLATHPLHFVRWSAIRQLGLLSPSRASRWLETACEDKHPHVRRAARQNLLRLRDATSPTAREEG